MIKCFLISKVKDSDRKRFNIRKNYLIVSLLLCFTMQVSAQKIDRNFGKFYARFQNAVSIADRIRLKQMSYFPFQTIYWVDGMNTLDEEEKRDGLIDSTAFDQYLPAIYQEAVKQIIPHTGTERIQQIDVAGSGDYYKRLGQVVDKGSTLLELYCQFDRERGGFGDDYFAFVFGKINGEYKVLAYYTVGRIKE